MAVDLYFLIGVVACIGLNPAWTDAPASKNG